MIALAVWGLAILRGLTRFWLRITYRTGRTLDHPHYDDGLQILMNRKEPLP